MLAIEGLKMSELIAGDRILYGSPQKTAIVASVALKDNGLGLMSSLPMGGAVRHILTGGWARARSCGLIRGTEMKLKIEIDLDNDAIQENFAVELQGIFRDCVMHALNEKRDKSLLDSNGNTVGRFEVTE